MFTKVLNISIFTFFLLLASCGLKKSWEDSGKYTSNKSLPSTYIWKKGKQYIAIVQTIPVTGRDKRKTIHPIKISENTIYNAFSKIKYFEIEKGKKSKPQRVFSEGNIDLLSRKVPEALSKANKDQDVLFEVFTLRKKFKFLPTTIDTTAGYLFIERGRINIIFEKINEDYQGYDYDKERRIAGSNVNGVYSGRYDIAKGWVVLTSKSWK